MASLNEYQTLGAAPSVSNDQWKKHALNKLAAGYLLILNPGRKFSRFYKGNGDLENCSYPTARKLLKEGYLEEVGIHITGTIYQLSEMAKDHAALTKIVQSQMGAVQVFEDDELDEESNDIGYDTSDALSEETIDGNSEEDDLSSTAT